MHSAHMLQRRFNIAICEQFVSLAAAAREKAYTRSLCFAANQIVRLN